MLRAIFATYKYLSVLFLLFIFFCQTNELSATEKKRVLFISSYNSGFPTFFNQIEGIKSVSDTASIELHLEFMDSKRFFTDTNFKLFTELLSYKIANSPQYDAIITSDDNALLFALEQQDSLFKNIPIVFCGVNNVAKAAEQNQQDNVTGVVEAVSMRETVELMVNMFPDSEEIYAIVDKTPSGQGDLNTFYRIAENYKGKTFKEISLTGLHFNDFRQRLSQIDSKTPVLLLSAYHDASGETIDFEESLKMIKADLKAPLFHLWYHGIGDGVLGGKLISHFEQGKNAASVVLDIFSGTPVNSFTVDEVSPNKFMFDYNELVKFDIENDQLPTGSIIINQPQSFFSKYKKVIFTTVGIIIVLISFIIILLINIVKRKKVEVELKTKNQKIASQNQELHQAKIEIEKSEKKFRNVVKSIPLGMYLYTLNDEKQLVFTETNEAADKIMGVKNKQFVGKTIEEAFPDLAHTEIPQQFKTIAEHGGVKHTQEIPYQDKNITGTFEAFNFQVSKNSMVTMFADISERVQMQTELEKYQSHLKKLVKERTHELEQANLSLNRTNKKLSAKNDELNNLLKRLKETQAQLIQSEKMASLGVLVAGVAHEINNPVNFISSSIIGLKENLPYFEDTINLYNQLSLENFEEVKNQIELLEEDIPVEEMIGIFKKSINIIEIGIERTITIVKGLRSFARSDEQNMSSYHVHENIENTLIILHFHYKDRIEIIRNFGTIPSIFCYTGQINQVLMNILSNAIQSISGKGTITISTTIDDDNNLCVSIKDTGFGIKEENISKIFDPFFTTKGVNKGTGLGLSISYNIIKEHNGYITVDSTVGAGTEFKIFLPLSI